MRRVLVTGGSRGIGRAICETLAVDWSVISPTRHEMDLSDMESVDQYFEANGNQFDAIVNNAGINIIKPIESISLNDISLLRQVNLDASLRIIQHCVPFMKKAGGGRIVNISSIWGVRSKEYRTLYSESKFALVGQVKALARELGPSGILLNAVCPGFTETEMTQQSLSSDEICEIVAQIPLRRLAVPSEIASLVAFLIGESNTYLTGQALIIDGGFTA